MQPRLKTHYETHVRTKLQEEFGFANPHRIPRIVKIVLNVGIGEASKDMKQLDSAVEELGIDHGPEGQREPCSALHLQLLPARGDARRSVGDASSGPDVVLPRSSDHDGDPAHS